MAAPWGEWPPGEWLAVAAGAAVLAACGLAAPVAFAAPAAPPHRATPPGIGGLGLGLAIVQAIAEAHGGSVRVQSTFGHGAKFELLLPLAPAAVGADRFSPASR